MKKLIQIFIAIIPLVVSFSTSDPTLAIRFLVLGCVVGFSLLILLFTKKSLFIQVIKHPVNICLIVILFFFSFSLFINGFSSASIYILLKMFLIFMFGLLVTHIILEYGFKEFVNSFVIFSLLLSIIYLFQFVSNYSEIMSFDKEWQRNREFDKLSATMGHKNLLSSIQFLMLPFLIYMITIGKKTWKVLSVIAIVLIAFTFLQTQTRAVLAAVFISVITFLLINKRNLQLKHILILFSSFVFSIIVGYSIMQYTDRLEAFKGEIEKTFEFSATARYKLYKSTLQLMAEHPILGVGPGNWKIDVWKYELYFDSWGDSFAQRPHNDFLWVFAEGGVFAGLSYILIFLILLRDSYLLHKNRKEEDGIIYSLLFATVMGYGFISLVDFPMERFSHNIIFFVLAAIIIASRLKQQGLSKEKLPMWVSYLFLLITCFAIYVSSIRYQGEIHAANAIHYKSKGNWNYVIKAIDKAYNPTYYEMENTSTPLLWYRGVAYFNQQRYELALKDFKAAFEVNPYHVHVLNNLATSYEMMGNHKKAKEYYNKVFDVCPTFKETRVNLAAILYNEKKYVEALDVILQSKLEAFSKRKKNNDNYDLYLKTIFNGWVNSISQETMPNEQKILNRLSKHFEKYPKIAEEKIKKAYQKRKEDNIDYLTALMLIEEE